LPVVPVLEGEELARARVWFEDKVVRVVRARGWCTEALSVLDSVFGGPLDGNVVWDHAGNYGGRGYSPAYLDSDGVDAWGQEWRDADGYSRKGLDQNGRDRDGYDKDGFDKDGYDREGLDKDGVSKNDPARFKFNRDGFDRDGFDREGYDRWGYNREGVNRRGEARTVDPFAFDKDGYDAEGYNSDGYNRAGEYSQVHRSKYRARI
jgi:hypothetical protein